MPNKCATLSTTNHQNGQIQLGHSLPLLLAIIISTLAHLYLLNQPLLDYLSIFQRAEKDKPVVIQAKLLKQPPPKVAEPPQPIEPAKPVKQKVKPLKKVANIPPKIIPPKPQPKVMALPTIAPKADTTALPPLTDTPIVSEAAQSSDTPAIETPVEMPAPTIETAETADITFEEEPVLVPYTHVESHYDVFVDPETKTNRSPAGEAHMTFTSNGDGYQLKSVIEPHGLIALFIPDLVQTSHGLIGEAGLQPLEYLHQFGSKKNKTRKAVFNWAENQLSMQTANGTQAAAVQPGAQDLLSFMYQFMFVTPLDNMQMTVTNGRKVSTYQYSFEGEEMVQTKVGAIKTMHILRTDDDQEDKTELWLAVDYRYLPVKIKKTETKKNKIYELVARSISTDQGSLTASDAPDGIAVKEAVNASSADSESPAVKQNKQAPTQLNPFLNR